MSTDNQVLRFLFDHTDIRGEITHLDTSYQEATKHQHLPASVKRLLGEFLAAAVLMSQTLKFEGTLTVKARGDGPLSLIMADVSDSGDVRCIAQTNPDSDVINYSDMTLPQLLGAGVLSIIIEPEKGERYQGIVPLEDDTLAKCLGGYFEQSEQLPTQLWLFADDTQCGGVFLQCLPAQEVTDAEKRKELWSTTTQLAGTVTQEELFNLDQGDLLYRLFNEFDCRTFKPSHLQFNCRCSQKKSENAILSLGQEDARQLVSEQDAINIDCQFCGQKYIFSDADLDRLFDKKSLH